MDLPAGAHSNGVNEEFTIALSTFPDEDTAKRIARELVESALAACANIVPSITSIYFWKEKVEESREVLVLFKTTCFAEFQERLHALHPYDVPEIIRLNIAEGSPEYLRWIAESCARPVIPSEVERSRSERDR
jgi:periplasmic divalent cation tolerance protein